MKIQIIIIIFVTLLSVIGFNGCIDNSPIKEPKLTSLDTFSLKVEDLPEGYVKWSEEYNLSVAISKIVAPIDVYDIVFTYKEPDNSSGFPTVQLTLSRFNSSNDAEMVLQNSSDVMSKILNIILNLTHTENIEQVGDSSVYKLYQGSLGVEYENESATWSYIYFRVESILVYLLLNEVPTSEIDYVDINIKYAKIVENRIKDIL